MDGRKDAPGLFMKWVTENNPNSNYNEVKELYVEVNNSIQSERDRLLIVENELQTINYEYGKLFSQVPSSWYLFYRKPSIHYIPISTEANKLVNTTGVDNNVKL